MLAPLRRHRNGLLAAIDSLLAAGRATGELPPDITSEDIAASLIGLFTVARPPEHADRATRLLTVLMDGLSTTSETAHQAARSPRVSARSKTGCSAK